MNRWAAFVILSLLAACGQPHTQNTAPPTADIRAEGTTMHVEDAWAPPTPNGVDVSAGYLTIVNGTNVDDQLLSAESPRAEHVEVHEMTMNGNVMQMRPVAALDVIAHDEVALSPNGRHLMFEGVKQPFAPGEQIPVDLTFAHAGKVHVVLDVHIPN